MSLCCLSVISSNDNNINSHYHWLAGNIVRPILELVENLFYDRINKPGEVKRLKEEIKQVELPDEEKRLKEEAEHDELPDEEKRLKEEVEHDELPDEEKRLEEEVEHAELPDEENKKKLGREKAGEHHQRMVWTGDRERIFAKIVTELDKNGSKNLFLNLKLQILSFIKCLMIVKITSYSASYVLFVV